jgi:hypothetical protein
MIDTTITTDMKDPKKSFDAISLARCCQMAMESLNPEEFEAFIVVHDTLIERRNMQNKGIEKHYND